MRANARGPPRPHGAVGVCPGLAGGAWLGAGLTPLTLPTGHTGRLLRALLVLSLLFLAAHLTFQICLHTVPGLDQFLGSNCELLKGWGRGVWGSRPGAERVADWRLEGREAPEPCRNLRSPWEVGCPVSPRLCLIRVIRVPVCDMSSRDGPSEVPQ